MGGAVRSWDFALLLLHGVLILPTCNLALPCSPHIPTAVVASPELYGMNVTVGRFLLLWPRIECSSGMRREAALVLRRRSGFSCRLHPPFLRCSLIVESLSSSKANRLCEPDTVQLKQTIYLITDLFVDNGRLSFVQIFVTVVKYPTFFFLAAACFFFI